MKTNVRQTVALTTHEGGKAAPQKPLEELTRAVFNCLLFESTYYESGSDIADRIAELSTHVTAEQLADLATKARTEYKLRHVPLWLLVQLVRHHRKDHGLLVRKTIAEVVSRPDEMGELISLYWKAKKQPLAAALKKGLALAFTKFKPYQLAKWDRDAAIKLKDVLFLVHAKPKDQAQADLWKQLIDGTLEAPDTWEVALSAGKDKKATWTRLLMEEKLGDIALLMNVRNMDSAGVEHSLIESALLKQAEKSKALPFRYVSAAKACPSLAQSLSDAMLKAVSGTLEGATDIVVDVSGSMDAPISDKSQLKRWEAAGALAILVRELCAQCRVFTFSNINVQVKNYRGLPLLEAIGTSQPHSSTYLAESLRQIQAHAKQADRLIVVTDEQAHDGIVPSWAKHAYLINVGPYKPGLTVHGGWTRINGWSERVIEWIKASEAEERAE